MENPSLEHQEIVISMNFIDFMKVNCNFRLQMSLTLIAYCGDELYGGILMENSSETHQVLFFV